MDDPVELSDVAERVLAGVDKLSGDQVISYGDLGRYAGTGARHAGRILAAHGHLVEWWRVVRADGTGHDPARAAAYWDTAGIRHHQGRVDMARHRVTFEP